MGRTKGKYWKPKALCLLSGTYKAGDSYPNEEGQEALNKDGYGSCSIGDGFDRSWTIDKLEHEIKGRFPNLKDELTTGIEFARLQPNSKKISIHVLGEGATVADLEKGHGQGILVILQKGSNASLNTAPKQPVSTPRVNPGNESPKKPEISQNLVQNELETLAQSGGSGGIKIAHQNMDWRKSNTGNWKPKDILLLPKTYKNKDSYPNIETKETLAEDGYGSCSIGDGFDRSWTIDKLEHEIKGRFPNLKDELNTGIEFARLKQGSREIIVHNLAKDATVADLEKGHGQGILVILQKGSNASLNTAPKQPVSTPRVNPGNESPKKPEISQNLVQNELETVAQLGGITFAHLNVCSVHNKIVNLKDMLELSGIDVLTLSETKMGKKHSTDKFNIPVYTIMARKDGASESNWPRGGVMTYVKNDLAKFAKECKIDLEKGLEAGCVIIELDKEGRPSTRQADQTDTGKCVKKTRLRIINVYVPPGTKKQIALLEKLQKSMDNLKAEDDCCKPIGDKKQRCSCKTNYVILGDFNCDRKTLAACKTMTCAKGKVIKALDKLESSHDLTQLIKDPTRVACKKERGRNTDKTTKTLLDLIYTDDTASVLASGVVHITMSDHYMVYCALGPAM